MGLTMLRLLLLPAFLYILLGGARAVEGPGSSDHHRWWAVGIFGIMAITDKLDGYLARKLRQTSKLGMMLDPVADKLLIVSSVMLLSLDWVAPQGYVIPWAVVAIVYGKDAIVVIGAMLLLSLIGTVSIAPRPLGKLATFLQLSMVIAVLLAPDLDRLHQALAWWVTRVLWLAVALVTGASGVDYLIQGSRQFAMSKPQRKELEAQMNTEAR
jgi:cardiolipin synthase